MLLQEFSEAVKMTDKNQIDRKHCCHTVIIYEYIVFKIKTDQ